MMDMNTYDTIDEECNDTYIWREPPSLKHAHLHAFDNKF